MMLVQPDGTIAEPARAHTRRGGIEGSGKGLGDGYRVADVDAAIERNAGLQKDAELAETVRARIAHDYAELQPRLEADARAALDRIRRGPAAEHEQQPGRADQPTVAPEPEDPIVDPRGPEPAAFRSGLRDVQAKDGSENIQRRIDGMAELEEDYRGALPDAEYEARLNEFGIGPHFMRQYGEHLDPETHRQLELRVQARAASNSERQRGQEHAERGQRLREQYDQLREDGNRNDSHGWMQRQEAERVRSRILASNSGIEKTNERRKEINELVKEGRYDDAAQVVERHREQDRENRKEVENYSAGLDRDDAPSASDMFSRAEAAEQEDRDQSLGR